MKKWLKIPVIVIGSVLVLLVLISCLAGPIAKNYVEKHSMELCHRKATVGKIRVNIFNGSVLINDLKVLEEDAKTKFLSFDELKVNMSLPMLLGKTVRLTEIGLDGLDATVIQNGSRFNFMDIIELYTNKPKKDDDTTASSWTIDLRNIQISNSDILYKDIQVGSHFGLKDIVIAVPQLRFSGGDSDISLDLDFAEGGKLGLKLLYDIQRGIYDLNVQMSKFQINAIQPYLTQSFNLDLLKGVLTGDLSVKGSLQHILEMDVKGNISLNNVHVNNKDKTPLLSMGKLSVAVDKVDLLNNDYHLTDVHLSDFDFHYDNYKVGNTLSRLIKAKKESSNQPTSNGKESNVKYLIDNLKIEHGKISYQDHTLYRKMSFPISDININVQHLQSGSSATVSLSAHLGKTGTLRCDGNVNPMDLSNANLQLSIANLAINEFSPYAEYYLAYPINSGLLSFTSKDEIKSNWLSSENRLDIYKPTFGDKQKNIKPVAANIPMKAAMYIITDRKGHVKMDLPVTGNISSPEFSFKKVIWKTFLNLLVKIAASPIDFIANVAGENTFKPMSFPLDQIQLTQENCYQLNEIAKVLLDKSEIQLHVSMGCPMIPAEDTLSVCNKMLIYNQIINYFSSQDISSSRLHLEDETDEKSPQGSMKMLFNLSVPE